MEQLIGFAIALLSIELLAARDALRDDAVFAWPTLRRDFAHAPVPLRALLDGLLAYRPFLVVLTIALTAAIALCFTAHPLLPPLLLVACVLVSLRFRGTYNGGSDYMTVVVLLSLTIARLGDGATARAIGLGYAAAQLVSSYFASGVAKLMQPAWRRGDVLVDLLRAPQYAAPAWLVALLGRQPRLGHAAALGVLTLECAFPLALLDGRAALILGTAALVFHVINALVLGLNRFLWAWLAAFPALLYWAGRVG